MNSRNPIHEAVPHEMNFPFRVFFQNLKSCPMHWHEDIEFLLVLRGKIDVIAGAQVFRLTEGQIMILSSGKPHATAGVTSNNLNLVLQLSPDYGSEFEYDLVHKDFTYTSSKDASFPGDLTSQFRKMMCRIIWEFRLTPPGFKFKIFASLNELLTLVIRNLSITDTCQAGSKREQEAIQYHHKLKELLAFCEEHYYKRISLEDAAGLLELNPSYFSRYFKKQIGATFTDYLNSLRLYKSLPELTKPEKTITEIALDYGFSDTRGYNRLFHSLLGTTPSTWRKLIKENPSSINTAKAAYGAVKPQTALDYIEPWID
ncbi:MAG: AraC family transcriptional regulator [Spirochaetia bacterium]